MSSVIENSFGEVVVSHVGQAKYPLVIIHITDDLVVHVDYAEHRSGHHSLEEDVAVHSDYAEHRPVASLIS